jgi:hypothetical protein
VTPLVARLRPIVAGWPAVLRRHWWFVAVLSVGTTLRALAWAAYQPALFYSDSLSYLANTHRVPDAGWHPPGYPWFLDAVLIDRHIAIVTAVQHLMILGDGIVIYLLLIRFGCSRIVATLACAPVLLDAYQVQIEQYILSEALFETLLVAAIAIALWPTREGVRPVRAWRTAVVALLIGLSVLVRLDAVGLIVPLLGWLVWTIRRQRAGWLLRPLLAISLGLGLPVAILLGLRGSSGGGVSITGSGPIWLYSRVASFANCPHDDIPADERVLCPTQPLGQRPGPVWFQDMINAPEWVYVNRHPKNQHVVEAFAKRVIRHQPLDYLHAVFADFSQQFRPTRAQTPNGPEVRSWQFRLTLTPVDPTKPTPQSVVALFGTGHARINLGIARVLRDYQRDAYLPGPVMGLLLLFGAVVLVVRRRHPLAPALLLVLVSGVVVVLVATATVLFSWRYMLPTLVLYPPAGAIAWVAMRTPAGRESALGAIRRAAARKIMVG